LQGSAIALPKVGWLDRLARNRRVKGIISNAIKRRNLNLIRYARIQPRGVILVTCAASTSLFGTTKGSQLKDRKLTLLVSQLLGGGHGLS
jgi:hypothetical protein